MKTRMNRFQKNEIIIYDDFAEIILYNKNNVECGRATIDTEDIEKVKNISWCKLARKVCGKLDSKNISLHHIILNFDYHDNFVVDHINRNFLDNRKINLRIVKQQVNTRNTKISKNNKSGTNGVCFDKKNNKWIAYIVINNKQIYLGRYLNIEDAILERKKAEIKYFGKIIEGR